jgi:hypothetical protein
MQRSADPLHAEVPDPFCTDEDSIAGGDTPASARTERSDSSAGASEATGLRPASAAAISAADGYGEEKRSASVPTSPQPADSESSSTTNTYTIISEAEYNRYQWKNYGTYHTTVPNSGAAGGDLHRFVMSMRCSGAKKKGAAENKGADEKTNCPAKCRKRMGHVLTVVCVAHLFLMHFPSLCLFAFPQVFECSDVVYDKANFELPHGWRFLKAKTLDYAVASEVLEYRSHGLAHTTHDLPTTVRVRACSHSAQITFGTLIAALVCPHARRAGLIGD